MTFRAAARLVGAAALAVVVTSTTTATGAAEPAGTANPVISSVAPDPSVTRGADGAFHVYASSDDWADGAGYRLIPHFRSFDLVEWEYVGDAFDSRPAWAPGGSFLWAPDVHLAGGGTDPGENADPGATAGTGAVMYYSTGGDMPCIGRATAPGVEGPWTHDDAPIVCHGEYRGEVLDPMDPEVVVTDDGPVMLMGNFEGIHTVSLTADGSALDGDPVRVAGTGVEAPAVVARDGYTHLFTSAGHCCTGEGSRYRVLAGRAESLTGPYETRTGASLMGHEAGDLILQGDADWVGPGHVDVVADDADQTWMIYHAAPRGSAVLPGGVQRRYLMLDRLDWVAVPGVGGTWPVVGDGTPSSYRPADPTVSLPVRLTADGDVARRVVSPGGVSPGGFGSGSGVGPGADADEVLDLSVVVDSTGAGYSGQLSATLTGPGTQRQALPIVTGEGPDQSAVPVTVPAGGSLRQSLTLRPAAPLGPGRYELVVAIGQSGAAQELAVFGLEVAGDGSLSLGSLGTGALGSVPAGSGSLGS